LIFRYGGRSDAIQVKDAMEISRPGKYAASASKRPLISHLQQNGINYENTYT
jgi:hypothetical protein